MEVHVGCSSWTSPSWSGRFYPKGLPDANRLTFYAREFDCVEVDATFYGVPSPAMTRGWNRRTPPNFRFTLKLSREAFDPEAGLSESKVAAFFASARELGPKLAAVVAQFPPSFRASGEPDGRPERFLEGLIDGVPREFRLAIELRHRSWYSGPQYERLRRTLGGRNVALVWSYLSYLEMPTDATADWLYLRFIGDHHTIPEEAHGEVRVDRTPEMTRWRDRLREIGTPVDLAFAFFNNHFAGYGVESARRFAELLRS